MRRRLLLGLALLFVLVIIVAFVPRSAGAGEDRYDFTVDGERVTIWLDVALPEDRMTLREIFGGNKPMLHCMSIADIAVKMMQERDEGTDEATHLDVMRKTYDDSKAQGSPVPWHLYVDYLRMVRDLHRRATTRDGGGDAYKTTDSGELWKRELHWCFSLRRPR